MTHSSTIYVAIDITKKKHYIILVKLLLFRELWTRYVIWKLSTVHIFGRQRIREPDALRPNAAGAFVISQQIIFPSGSGNNGKAGSLMIPACGQSFQKQRKYLEK